MPAIIWIAIALAIVILGIGGSVAMPQLPETVIRPVAERSVDLFAPTLLGVFIALGMLVCFCAYLKFFRKGGQ